MVGAKRLKSIADVLEEVDVLIYTHCFNEFLENKQLLWWHPLSVDVF